MPDTPAVADVGFAAFVAVLLVETLDSIVAAHSSQEDRRRAVEESAGMTPEEFAATAVPDDVVAAALGRTFPGKDGGTALVVGGTVPRKDVLADLGVVLADGDVEGRRLTAAGVARVTEAVRLAIARDQLESIREIARRGMPKVVVDGGTLRSKLTFSTVRAGTAPPAPAARPAVAAPAVVPSVRAGALDRLATMRPVLSAGVLDSIRDLRLTVRPPAADDPATPGATRADVYGEVEIRFHTEV
jgi:hypothetical protein